jgi:hypothetical protein
VLQSPTPARRYIQKDIVTGATPLNSETDARRIYAKDICGGPVGIRAIFTERIRQNLLVFPAALVAVMET